MALDRWYAALLLSLSIPATAQSREVPSADTTKAADWVRSNAVDVGPVGSVPSAAEAAALSAVIGDARVIGFGEPLHGAEEPLAYRNRLIRHLVETGVIDIVALESGLAQGRRVDAWIQGGPGDPEEISRNYLNWGFGTLAANVDLMRWLRAWNADPSHRRIHFYAADVSGGDLANDMPGARLPLDDLVDHLARAAPRKSRALRAKLKRLADRFTPVGYAKMRPADRAGLDAALLEATALMERDAPAMIARTSADAHDWAARMADDGRALAAMFAVWPQPGGDQIAGWIAVSKIRDRAMADYVKWALKRGGPGARLLIFAANGHVSPSFWDLRLTAHAANANSMGANLRAELGDDYRVIATTADRASDDFPTAPPVPGVPEPAKAAGSLDAVLRPPGASPILIDTRKAEPTGWWHSPQTIATVRAASRIVPTTAVDAILSLPRLSPARVVDPTDKVPH